MRANPTTRLRVDWTACEGAGLCAELLPELVTLDEWGYPIVADPVTPDILPATQEAVRYCPRSALRLTR